MGRRSSALPEKIAQDLMSRILADEYANTNMLPSERILQETYGVSRTVIREAIKLLAARGLVSTGSGQGAVISSNLTTPAIDALLLAFHRADVRVEDLINTRLMLEPKIAAMAAEHATLYQIRRLYDSVDELASLSSLDQAHLAASRSYVINARFHTALAEASQDPVLKILIEILVGIIWRHHNTVDVVQDLSQHQKTAEAHLAIVRAVDARDPVAAREAMYQHLSHTRDSLAQREGSLYGPLQAIYHDL